MTQIKSFAVDYRRYIMLWSVLTMMAISALPSWAQSTLEIDMAPIFEQTNYWTAQLFPILAISIGIAIAIALIGFIGNSIMKAFRGG